MATYTGPYPQTFSHGATTGEVLVSGATFSGGIVNSGTIQSGVVIEDGGFFSGSVVDATTGTISGGIVLQSGGFISNGRIADFGIISGGISIQSGGKVLAATTAVLIAGKTFTGGLSNAGAISGSIGIDVRNVSNFAGGIINASGGAISGTDGPAIAVSGGRTLLRRHRQQRHTGGQR